jgi:hypothetical protein
MTSFNIFICNDFINKLNTLKYKPIQTQIGFTYGQLYNFKGIEIPHINDKIIRMSYKLVFGFVLTFHKKHINYILSIVDAYNMCSNYKYSIANPTDLTQRVCIDVYIVQFNTFNEFCEYKYKISNKEKCYVWYFNKLNIKATKKLKKISRIECGISQQVLQHIKERCNG